MLDSQRYQTGLELLNSLDRNGAAQVQAALAEIAPDMGRFIIEFAFGDIASRPGLDIKSREMATVAALAGLGNAQPQLKFHIGAALNAGCSPEEIVEIMYLVAVFAGFPAALNGVTATREVFAARGVQVKASPIREPGAQDRRRLGLQALEATSQGAGRKVLDSLADLAPDLAGFILDFSYGEVIARSVLSAKHKEIVMMAVAAARGTMRPQLMVHIKAGLQVGLTRQEITEVLMQMAVYAGFPAALNGLFAAREVFAGQQGA
jgi:4-carboxymuconolactone decarboxylase